MRLIHGALTLSCSFSFPVGTIYLVHHPAVLWYPPSCCAVVPGTLCSPRPRTNAVLPSLDCALLKASLVLVWWNRNKSTPCQCASVPAGRLHLLPCTATPKYTATPTACSTVFCSASSPPTVHARAQLGLPSHGSLCSTPATLTLAPTSTNVVLVQAVPPSWTSRQCIASVTIAVACIFLPPRVLGSLMRVLLSYFPGDVSESMLRTLRFNLRRTLQVTEKEIAERFGFAPPTTCSTRTLAA